MDIRRAMDDLRDASPQEIAATKQHLGIEDTPRIVFPTQYLAFVLDRESKERVLKHFPAVHPKIKAHHVTLMYDIEEEHMDNFLRIDCRGMMDIRVIAHAFDDRVQAVAVTVNDTMVRPDQKLYHITVSTAMGVPASESNLLLAKPNIPGLVHTFPVYGSVQMLSKRVEKT